MVQMRLTAPHDGLSDDPPMDWEAELDACGQATLQEEAHEHHESRWGHGAMGEAPLNTPSPQTHPQKSDEQAKEVGDDVDELFRRAFDDPAGTSLGMHHMVFEQLQQQQKGGDFGMFGRFLDQQEWELADWLMTSSASQTKVDRF
ncbi:hypothetical protein JB92DRAFT_3124375 [Gautieria morchelliformis]|nr:hypothetical protein JB92DRAFT_3124375 [Gautieria morchelliformis]